MAKPKVLIGAPITSLKAYCMPEYIQGIRSLSYKNKKVVLLENGSDERFLSLFDLVKDIQFERTSADGTIREKIVRDRNTLRKMVLKEGFDYFFSLEQDVVPPKNVIEELLSHKKKVCSALYFKPVTRHGFEVGGAEIYKRFFVPMLGKFKKEREKIVGIQPLKLEEAFPSRLLKADICGLGCVLIHRSVLEKIEFRFDENKKFNDDFFFAVDCFEEGVEIWADTSLTCRHYFVPWEELTQ